MLITLKKEDKAVITIRPATVEDIVAIEAIAKEAYEPYVPRIGQNPAPLVEDYVVMVDRGVTDVAEDARCLSR